MHDFANPNSPESGGWLPSFESVCDFIRGINDTITFRPGDVGLMGDVVYEAASNDLEPLVFEVNARFTALSAEVATPVLIGTGKVARSTINLVIGLSITALPDLVGCSNSVAIASVQADIRNSLRLRVEDCSKHTSYHQMLRNRFRRLPFSKLTAVSSNPHGFHAGVRTQARQFAGKLAHAMKFNAYQVPDPETMVCHPDAPIPDRPLFVMIDVDFKLTAWQLQRFLSKGPVLMYTYLLDRLSYQSDQGGFSFHDGLLTSLFDGGVSKQHPIWDWNRDQMVVSGDGFPSILAMVDHRPMADVCRAMVLLTPVAYYPSSAYFLVNTLYLLSPMERFASNKLVCPKTNMIVEYSFILGKVVLLINGKTAYTLEADVYHDLCAASRTTAAFSVHTVGRLSKSTNVYLLKEALSVLAPLDGACTVSERPRDYRPIFADLPEDEVLRGTLITKPILDIGLIPSFGPGADEACVQGRVEGIRPDENRIPDDMQEYSDEFRDLLAEHLCPNGVLLEPYTAEDILDACEPNEKAKYSAAAEGDPFEDVIRRTFQKVEAYPEIKPPRDIKDVPKPLVMDYSRFVKAVVDALKKSTFFYAFGLAPEELVRRVVRVCEGKPYICTTDFSKFDGTQGRWIFNEFLKDMIRLFPACYTEHLRQLLKQHTNLLHVTKFGRFFLILFQMLSGGADTSLRNTIHSARGCFIALRRCGLSKKEAWELMGLLGGDDGLAYYPDIKIAIETFDIIGFKIKLQKKNVEDRIDFLGRIYIDPFGSLNSHHDITRAAGKLHISPHELDNVSREVMAWRKAVSIWVTDSKTPVLTVWARTVLRIVPQGTWQSTWHTKAYADWPLEHGKQYLSERIQADWCIPIFPPPTPAQSFEVLQHFLDEHCISLAEYKTWEAAMDSAMDFTQFPGPLRVTDHVSTTGLPSLVDGQLSGTPAVDTSTIVCFAHITAPDGCVKENCPDHHPKYFCRDFVKGVCKRKEPPCVFAHINKNTRVEKSAVVRPPKPRSRNNKKKEDKPTSQEKRKTSTATVRKPKARPKRKASVTKPKGEEKHSHPPKLNQKKKERNRTKPAIAKSAGASSSSSSSSSQNPP